LNDERDGEQKEKRHTKMRYLEIKSYI